MRSEKEVGAINSFVYQSQASPCKTNWEPREGHPHPWVHQTQAGAHGVSPSSENSPGPRGWGPRCHVCVPWLSGLRSCQIQEESEPKMDGPAPRSTAHKGG